MFLIGFSHLKVPVRLENHQDSKRQWITWAIGLPLSAGLSVCSLNGKPTQDKPRMRSRMNEWEKILREEWYSRREPDEDVVDLVSLLTVGNKNLRVLDLGCGAGRNQVYVAKHGFEAHGVDVSKTGLILTKERLKGQSLEVYLVKCDMKALSYVCSCLMWLYVFILFTIKNSRESREQFPKSEGY
jgi:SAM-dependent methyltransferase